MNKDTQEKYDEFLDGFATEAELDRAQATEQWAGFSRQLSDSERNAIESRGWDAGVEQGKAFNELFGNN